jgi:pimeloyl-ACP methyl ester carboxylesterase
MDFGNSRKPTLICLHGLTRNARDFLPVGELLGETLHVIAVDIRGRGESGWGPPREYTLSQYVEDLSVLFDTWGVATASLLGTSMGGLVAMLFASRFPQRVDRLALNDIGPETSPKGIERIVRTTTLAPSWFEDRRTLIAYFRAYMPTVARFSDEEVWDFARSSIRSDVTGGWTWRMDPAVRLALLDEGRPVAPELWSAFRGIEANLLVLRGESSDVLSLEVYSRMRDARPDGLFVEVSGVGHTPFLTEPVAEQALRRFFIEQDFKIKGEHYGGFETMRAYHG